MTRKQYRKKVRHLQRNIARYAKETGGKRITKADRVQIPNFGCTLPNGEILRSYAQCWSRISEAMAGTGFLVGLP